MNKVTKRLSMGTLAALMLFGGMFAYSANAAESVQARNCPPTFITLRSTALYRTHHTGSQVHHTISANRHVVGISGLSITNSRRAVTHGSTNGWVHNAHLAGAGVTC